MSPKGIDALLTGKKQLVKTSDKGIRPTAFHPLLTVHYESLLSDKTQRA